MGLKPFPRKQESILRSINMDIRFAPSRDKLLLWFRILEIRPMYDIPEHE